MKKAPAWEEMYEKYDLSLCGETAAVEDDEVHALWEHFGSIPCFWHSLQRPAQGLAYVLGERVWLEGRVRAQDRAGEVRKKLDLRAFHNRGISLGSVGLDLLTRELG